MALSVGKIVLPVQSTFDPSGIEAAKAGVRDVQQAAQKASQQAGQQAAQTPAPTVKWSERKEADRLFRQTRTGQENYDRQVLHLEDLHNRGTINAETYQRAKTQAQEKYLPKAQPSPQALADIADANRFVRETRSDAEKYQEHATRLADLHKKGFLDADTYQRATTQVQEKYLPATPDPAAKLQEAAELAGKTGLGRAVPGLEGLAGAARGLATPMMGVATAAVGVFVGLQKAAGQAREIRLESAKLGTSVKFYKDLAWNARDAGISMEEAVVGVQRVGGMGSAARGGDLASMAYFASLGIRPDQLWSMAGDNGRLAHLAAHGTAAQQIQGFGSVAAAQAAAQSEPEDPHARVRNDALENSYMALPKLAGKVWDGVKWVAGEAAAGSAVWGRSLGSGVTPVEAGRQLIREATLDERREAEGRRQASASENGTKHGLGLLTVRERLAADAQAEKGYDYGQLGAQYKMAPTVFSDRAETARRGQQLQFDRQFMNPYERLKADNAQLGDEEKNKTLTPTQAYRAKVANFERGMGEVSGVRSDAENLRLQMLDYDAKWHDPKATEQTRSDAARQMNDQFTGFAGSLTAAGPQAGAYGVNTVQGASMLMGAEYQMDQSQQTLRMVELLTQIAVNTGKMTPSEAAAVRGQQGFRFRDPISALFGN